MVNSPGKLSSWTTHSAATDDAVSVCLYVLHLCITQSISWREALVTKIHSKQLLHQSLFCLHDFSA